MSRIAALGDSLTYGYGLPRGYGWVERIAKSFPESEIFNFGMPGDTAKGIAERSREVLLRLQPEILLLLAGTNDILNGEMPLEPLRHYEKILAYAREQGSLLILLEVPDITENPGPWGWFDEREAPDLRKSLADLRKKQREFAEKHALYFISLTEALKGLSQEDTFLEDGVHLTSEAHERIAEMITYSLQENVGISL